jgi:hypothetical protein
MIVPRQARRLSMNDGKLTAVDLAILRYWVIADRQLNGLYASLDPRDPTRIVVEADGKKELVELTRVVVNGNPTVMAVRRKLHGE